MAANSDHADAMLELLFLQHAVQGDEQAFCRNRLDALRRAKHLSDASATRSPRSTRKIAPRSSCVPSTRFPSTTQRLSWSYPFRSCSAGRTVRVCLSAGTCRTPSSIHELAENRCTAIRQHPRFPPMEPEFLRHARCKPPPVWTRKSRGRSRCSLLPVAIRPLFHIRRRRQSRSPR